jgi:malonate-semialdehyde dehydrogenase (acetylating)/methylmalonate-semialdehyde dehydrogenase
VSQLIIFLFSPAYSLFSKLVAGQEVGQIGPVIDLDAQKRILSYIDEAEKGGAKILLSTTKSLVLSCPLLKLNRRTKPLKSKMPILMVTLLGKRLRFVTSILILAFVFCSIYTTTGSTAEWFTKRFSVGMVGVNIGVPVPREPFSFGGSNASKFGDMDITGLFFFHCSFS